MSPCAGRPRGHRHRGQTYGHRGGGGANRERSTGTHTLPYVRQTRGLQPGLCDNLEEWGAAGGGTFKREGTSVYLWLIHDDVWQKLTPYCKVIILQLKNKEKVIKSESRAQIK